MNLEITRRNWMKRAKQDYRRREKQRLSEKRGKNWRSNKKNGRVKFTYLLVVWDGNPIHNIIMMTNRVVGRSTRK